MATNCNDNSSTTMTSPVEKYFLTLEKVETLQHVLDFWFPPPPPPESNNNDDYDKKDTKDDSINSREYLNKISYITNHVKGWMEGGEEMDQKCKVFRQFIRDTAAAASTSAIAADNDKEGKEEKDDGKDDILNLIAKLILFDQIPRNAFRYEAEAYAYNDLVVNILHQLLHQHHPQQITKITKEHVKAFMLENSATLTFADCLFIGIACQHQENSVFHSVDSLIYDEMEVIWPGGEATKEFMNVAREHAEDHEKVLEQFGRYPHRNENKGRVSTEEEREWLEDYENLPRFVKSQLKNQKC